MTQHQDDVFAPALSVANAVLYEGYLLYPYTASAPKNRIRWQFGVVVPRAYLSAGTGENAEQQTEVLIETGAGAAPDVTVRLRFLHVEARRVEAFAGGAFAPVESLKVDATTYLTFDEAVEEELTETLAVTGDAERVVPIAFAGGLAEETLRDAAGDVRGRIVRERWPLSGTLTLRCDAVPADASLRKLQVRVENASEVVAGERSGALRTALVSTHVLLRVQNGRFVSVLDPTPAAAEATAKLANRHVFPVLVGDAAADAQRSTLVLSSPIILYDFPAVAPQTDSDAFDGTEIDELLTLSVLSLPDAERDEARATDPRARAIIERAESFSMHDLARVHAGTLYHVGTTPAVHDPFAAADPVVETEPNFNPFRRPDPFAGGDPFGSLDVPGLDCVFVNGVKITKGSSVRLHPKRRADAHDMFLAGKVATVRAVHQDVEDVMYVAVTVDEDPASDLHDWYGRSFFFYPDEVEPLGAPL
ncbi:MAG: hypothetical protein M3169_00715 [Candidatus Eremiobacteraeota bacterium]|nr:hypothetical protein [Candidatus Eremiobacteraeota bacterium]